MSQHIGIVACSAPGAALCYSVICTEAPRRLGPHAHPEVSLHAFSFAEHVRCLETNDWRGVGELLLWSAEKLAAIGAELLICPDNTAHEALDLVANRSPLPWLNVAEIVAGEAQRQGYARVGLLGTRYLMQGRVYAGRLAAVGIEVVLQGPAERERLNAIIFEELAYGRTPPAAQREVKEIIELLRLREGCEAVILGCTEAAAPRQPRGLGAANPGLDEASRARGAGAGNRARWASRSRRERLDR